MQEIKLKDLEQENKKYQSQLETLNKKMQEV